MNEVTWGGNALKFDAVVCLRMIRTRQLKIEDKVNLLPLLIIRSINKLVRFFEIC